MLYVSSASLSISQIFCTSATEILTQIVKYKDNAAQRILGDSASPKDNNGEKEPLVMSATRKQWMQRINGQTNAQNIRGVGVQGHVQACSFSLPRWLYLSPSLFLSDSQFLSLSLSFSVASSLSFFFSFFSLARSHTHTHTLNPPKCHAETMVLFFLPTPHTRAMEEARYVYTCAYMYK